MAYSKSNNLFVRLRYAGRDVHYKGRALGTIGHIDTSFHETKTAPQAAKAATPINLIAPAERKVEVIQEKGTNRSQFFRGQVDKYTWRDIGSSYLIYGFAGRVSQRELEVQSASIATPPCGKPTTTRRSRWQKPDVLNCRLSWQTASTTPTCSGDQAAR